MAASKHPLTFSLNMRNSNQIFRPPSRVTCKRIVRTILYFFTDENPDKDTHYSEIGIFRYSMLKLRLIISKVINLASGFTFAKVIIAFVGKFAIKNPSKKSVPVLSAI